MAQQPANPFFSNPDAGFGQLDPEGQLAQQEGIESNMFAASAGSGSTGAGAQTGTNLANMGTRYGAAQTTFQNDLNWANMMNQFNNQNGKGGGGGFSAGLTGM
jgi:hypothetical protein